MKHPVKPIMKVPQTRQTVTSDRSKLSDGNFADPKGKHFLVTNQREAELAQARLRRQEGYQDIKEKITSIADRKGFKVDPEKWKDG